MKVFLKKAAPYIVAVVSFLLLAYGYSSDVLTGKVVDQADISSWKGMSREIVEHNESHPDDPTYWTNSMFSGMPAVPISVVYEGDYTDPLYRLLFIGERPASYLFISMLGAFLMFLAFGVNVRLAALGAFAVTFCAYNMQIIQVGHNSKMVAIAFMPWVMAGLVYAYRKRIFAGALLFAFALSFQIKANHPQITYYLAFLVLAYAVAEFVRAVRTKEIPSFVRKSVVLLAGGILGIATNVNHLWPTYEYAKYSMRGGSELSSGESGGLEKEYATMWSYSPQEMMNLMIPDFNGGASSGSLGHDSETYRTLESYGYPAPGQTVRQMPLYWGQQPFTAGPMYMGAVTVFLFVLAMILYRGSLKWCMLAATLLAVFLSWGSYSLFLSDLFFRYMPLYSKFRTVSMVLVLLQLTLPVMGILVLDGILKGVYDTKKTEKSVLWAFGVTAGLSLLFAVIPSLAGNFVSPVDGSLPEPIAQSLREDRKDLLVHDALRSAAFITLAALAVLMWTRKKLSAKAVVFCMAAAVVLDMWTVDKRYLNSSHFVQEYKFDNRFVPRPVDKLILEDSDPDYRVLDCSVNTFNDAFPSYFHKTIGGYSPAKMQRYEEMIRSYIIPEIGMLGNDIANARTVDEAENMMGYYPVLSMLNTRYVILESSLPPLVNRYAAGNAWFVDDVVRAENPDEEIAMVGEVDPARTAVVGSDFIGRLDGLDLSVADSTAVIELVSYAPNRLVYEYESETDNLAVFSEVYYPEGWTAYVDGTEVPVLRADYILRAMKLPEGEHTVEFSFMPESIVRSRTVSRISSGLLMLGLLGLVGVAVRRYVAGKGCSLR